LLAVNDKLRIMILEHESKEEAYLKEISELNETIQIS